MYSEVGDLFDLYNPRDTDLRRRNPRTLDRVFFTTIGLENSADVTFTGRDDGTWPGDAAIDGDSQDVALDWYLSRSRAGRPPSGHPRSRPRQPLDRGRKPPHPLPGTDAKGRSDLGRGSRPGGSSCWSKRKNYEPPLATLHAWWKGPQSPHGCGKLVAASLPLEPLDCVGVQASDTPEDGTTATAAASESKPRCRVFGCPNAAPTNGAVEQAAAT